jgi:hypothetical protein
MGGGVRVEEGYNIGPKKLANKNVIKPKIWNPHGNFVLKALTLSPPPRDFGKNLSFPLPWIFNPCASIT